MDYQEIREGCVAGVWSLRHIPSGKVIIGSTSDIAKQKRYQIMLLRNGKHKTPEFQKLFDLTKDLTDLAFSFGVTSDPTEQKTVYETWVKRAISDGSYLTARKGKRNDSVEAVGRTSGMYVISFTNSGLFYVGSSARLKRRLSQHKSMLKNRRNTCRLLQEAYNHDSVYTVIAKFTDTLDEARKLEQEYIDNNKGNPLLLNLAADVNAPCRNLHGNPMWYKRILEAASATRMKPEVKESKRIKMKAYWSNPEAKAKRMGAGNPFARKISVHGVEYGSVMDAVRAGVMPDSVLRKQLKDPKITDVVYLT